MIFLKGNVVKWFFKVSHKKNSSFNTILVYSIYISFWWKRNYLYWL